jgi:outer membrane protein OmpA-like peptidoglycan-associated protein
MAFRQALLAATMLAVPVVAQAQPISGLYVGAGAGINWLVESDLDLTGPVANGLTAAERKGSVGFNAGWVGVISLGWGFGNGVRAEVEASYRENEVDSISGFAIPSNVARSSGRARSYGIMANALYDFDLGMPFLPYIGLGAGYQWHEYKGVRLTATDAPGAAATFDGTDGRFAYQAIVGAAYALDSVLPGLALTAEYRFMGTLQPNIDVADSGPGVPTTRGSTDVDNFNHSIMLGIRYAFNAAPPAPPPVAAPAAAPAPARTFLVFFDWDRADLTDRARAIIAEAAQNAQRTGSARIEVAGHADRSGTPQYNQRLSERRAQAVAAELERRGVARSAMVIQAFGESRPLVPTADGVREPQNRRVEIVLR